MASSLLAAVPPALIVCCVLLSGCSDGDAREREEQTLAELELLKERVQANEELLNRIYRQAMRDDGNEQIQEAADMAQAAMDAANASQACCEANEERINRMYQKIMSQ